MDNMHTTTIKFSKFDRNWLAIVSLLFGISKCFYLQGSSTEVSLYSELYVSSIFVSIGSQITITVCCVEILLGLSLLFARFTFLSTFYSICSICIDRVLPISDGNELPLFPFAGKNRTLWMLWRADSLLC